MTKEEADEKVKLIFAEWIEEEDALYDKLVAEGHSIGLDGFSELFKPIGDKYKKKIMELAAQIDE